MICFLRVCSHVAESEEYYTGLALFNPNTQKATFTISAYSKEGTLIGSVGLELKAGHRISKLISELIPTVQDLVGGTIRIVSDRLLVGQQFFGNKDQSYISSVPPGIIR
jgi:hypothetical protein